MRRILQSLSVGALLAVVTVGCGSAATNAASSAPSASSSKSDKAPVPVKTLAAEMVLHDGDLNGFKVLSASGETLKEQYPPAHAPHRAALVQLVRKSWLASAHSVIGDDHGNKIVSDTNLFRTPGAASRLWHADNEGVWTPRSVTLTRSAPPNGSPKGATFFKEVGGGVQEFSIEWRQGRVVSWVAIIVDAKTRLTARDNLGITLLLRAASQRVADRVAHPSHGITVSEA